jgi:hypothetical protein
MSSGISPILGVHSRQLMIPQVFVGLNSVDKVILATTDTIVEATSSNRSGYLLEVHDPYQCQEIFNMINSFQAEIPHLHDHGTGQFHFTGRVAFKDQNGNVVVKHGKILFVNRHPRASCAFLSEFNVTMK